MLKLLKRRRKKRQPQGTKKSVPSSIVVRHGRTTKQIRQLVDDLRRVMMPHTALHLKERRGASMKDYVGAAGQLAVSHILAVSQASKAPVLRVARMPYGPTLSFRIEGYALTSQIRSVQKNVFDATGALLTPPLVVLNNFEDSRAAEKRHLKIASLTFQAMFPAINVRTVKLVNCQRVLLLHLNVEEETIEFRHYLIRTKVSGLSRAVKRIVRSNVPDLSKAEDISDILNANALSGSESEFEDESHCVSVPLANNKRSKKKVNKEERTSQSVVRLSEIGPRMTMNLYKVEDGMFTGEVQYHKYESRSKEEVLKLREKHAKEKALKDQRRQEQEENVKRKREIDEKKMEAKKAKKQRRLDRQAAREQEGANAESDASKEEEEEEEGSSSASE
mmetsp:Transcript_28230/g.45409  ORF Transcript_28230/g.45409 Transcript_28230/m.45409 type:complete len:391 (-) Transcript_28230:4-1176(-)